MSYARKYRRYKRWARYIRRNEKHDARRTMGWLRAMSGAARSQDGRMALPWFGEHW